MKTAYKFNPETGQMDEIRIKSDCKPKTFVGTRNWRCPYCDRVFRSMDRPNSSLLIETKDGSSYAVCNNCYEKERQLVSKTDFFQFCSRWCSR